MYAESAYYGAVHVKRPGSHSRGGSDQVVAYVRGLIESGALHAGDRLPTERELSAHLGVSRPTVRAGLRALATLGVVRSRRGSGTFITDGPPVLGSEPLSFLAALHGFTRGEMYEVRRILEVGAAGLAADRASADHISTLADEVAGMFATLDDPNTFLSHDIRFHRTVGLSSGNPIVASLAEMVSGMYYEHRRATAVNASDRDLREAAEAHRRIYQAIRARDAQQARDAMNEHLRTAQAFQEAEPDPPVAVTRVTVPIPNPRSVTVRRAGLQPAMPRQPQCRGLKPRPLTVLLGKSSERRQQIQPRLADLVFRDRNRRIGVARAALRVDDVEVRRRACPVADLRDVEHLRRFLSRGTAAVEHLLAAPHALVRSTDLGSRLAQLTGQLRLGLLQRHLALPLHAAAIPRVEDRRRRTGSAPPSPWTA